MKREYTATVFILQEGKVLLIKHKKYGKWLPPGGHLEPDELPPEGAIREAFEETGLVVELIREEHLWIPSRLNGGSFERPFLCLCEKIDARPGCEAHEHIDFIYLAMPISGHLMTNHETEGIGWFDAEEAHTLETFDEVKEIISYILHADKDSPSHLAFSRR